MATYRFRRTGEDKDAPIELANDDAAWATLIRLCFDELGRANASPPSGSDIELSVTDHLGQDVAVIRVSASRRRSG